MPLTLTTHTLADPDGHKPALLLKGDWLVAAIGDGHCVGYGEMSHSTDDRRARQVAAKLFDEHVADMKLSLASIRALEAGPMAQVSDFVEATAVSAINQALYELLALREGAPVWRLLIDEPCRQDVEVYATINRALESRSAADHCRAVAEAIEQGFTAGVKCAPFERVAPGGEQAAQASEGLARLAAIRDAHCGLSLRIDCHERFTPGSFTALLPHLKALDPAWLEAPSPIGPAYAGLRAAARPTPIALGEMFFGWNGFEPIVAGGWADVIMPDVKHVGGFGPLVDVARRCAGAAAVSPHNPAGPVATAASLHAAAVCTGITSLEMVLIADRGRAYYLPDLRSGRLPIPAGAGWGESLREQVRRLR